jgi:hypothetical protein
MQSLGTSDLRHRDHAREYLGENSLHMRASNGNIIHAEILHTIRTRLRLAQARIKARIEHQRSAA